jgi:tight adherence protein B
MGLLVALLAAYGVFLLFTAIGYRWTGVGLGPSLRRRPAPGHGRSQVWLAEAGLTDVNVGELAAVAALLFLVGATLSYAIFGGWLPALLAGLFAATFPVASNRGRRERRRSDAREAWPRMIEEMRLLTGSLGRSIPQALFEVGRRGPQEMRSAFAAAQREWMISTDFARTVEVLKHGLADPTADATCETLLVAHEVGGSDLDRRLVALIDDRQQDLQGRKDARSKQAGVRFARRFVLVVPLGMALAGLSIGTGHQAYDTTGGQLGVAVALAMVALCWFWAGRLLRLPEEQRVFQGAGAS